MSACAKCHDSGFVAVCVEPMAGLAGYESHPCGCEPIKRFPMPEANHAALEAAWAEADRLSDVAVSKDAIAARADEDRWRAHEAAGEAWAAAEAIGPRPVKVST